jgi:hypothetical protein
LVAVVAFTLAISTPRPLHAILCCTDCGYTTSQYWTKAPTCAEAQTAYRALAKPEADSICGGTNASCALSIPPCEDWHLEDPANPWKIDGVASFCCKDTCEINP